MPNANINPSVVLSGTGLWIPKHSITNEELVDSYNTYSSRYNEKNAADIEAGKCSARPYSSAEFIEKASGIKNRYVYEKEGILDAERMRPSIPERAEDELSHQAEMAVAAGRKAMASP